MNKQSGQTLVASLFVIAIIAILAVTMLRGSGESSRPDGLGRTLPTQVKLKAKDDVCISNLGQVRSSIMIARANADDAPPAELSETGLSADFMKCPIGGEPFVYNAESGTVSCPHPGHEKY